MTKPSWLGTRRRVVLTAMRRPRQFTLNGAVSLVWRFGFRFLALYLGFGTAIYLAAKPDVIDLGALRGAFLDNWALLSLMSAVGATIDLLKDSVSLSRGPDKRDANRIALGLLTGFLDDWNRLLQRGGRSVVERLLPLVEKAVEAALRQHGIEGTISSNLMVGADDQALELRYWGTRHSDREEIRLPIDVKDPLPGAPAAYRSRNVIYIHDTHAEPYCQHFDIERPYRSVLSIPIPYSKTGGPQPHAVLNVDSDEPDGFVSEVFVRDHVLPALRPWLVLLAMERRL